MLGPGERVFRKIMARASYLTADLHCMRKTVGGLASQSLAQKLILKISDGYIKKARRSFVRRRAKVGAEGFEPPTPSV